MVRGLGTTDLVDFSKESVSKREEQLSWTVKVGRIRKNRKPTAFMSKLGKQRHRKKKDFVTKWLKCREPTQRQSPLSPPQATASHLWEPPEGSGSLEQLGRTVVRWTDPLWDHLGRSQLGTPGGRRVNSCAPGSKLVLFGKLHFVGYH